LASAEIQQLAFAGGIFGASQQEVVSAIGNVQEKLAEYRRGQGDFQVLGQIGVSTEGVDAIGFIDRLSERFSQFSEQRAQELGKKLGLDANFIALLQSGRANMDQLRAEFVELGGVINQDGIQSAADFNDSMFRLSTIIQSVRDKVILAMLPAFTGVAESVASFVKQNRALIEQDLTTFIESVVHVLGLMVRFLIKSVQLWNDFVDTVGGVKNAVTILGIAFVAFQLATSASLIKVVKSIADVGIAATLANAKVLLIPLGIAAAVAIAVLALNELYTFINGGDSYLGDMVEGFQAWRKELEEIAPILDAMLIPLDALIKAGEVLGTFAGQVSTGEFSQGINALSTDIKEGNFGNIGGFIADRFGALTGNVGSELKERASAVINMVVEAGDNTDPVQLGRDIVKGIDNEASARGLDVLSPINNGQ